jgi:hypothetical protein
MPKEDTTVVSGPTTSNGDRLNKGDNIYLIGAPAATTSTFGAGDFTETCGDVTVSLCAQQLFASTLVFASILLSQ